ncbi:MAG: sigma-70 family RNA polymerase sigma factor [Patescibacteria group bacterium]|nr:sigma-70 family RNA polymerase sigma factor [Patescibacteria group bacterium]
MLKSKENFQEIYQEYYKKVYNYFYYRTGLNGQISEDLMQETFLKAYNKWSEYQDRGYSYLTYLLKIAHNLLVNYYRDLRPTGQLQEIPFNFIEKLQNDYDIKILWQEIKKLSLIEKEVMLLRYRSELPIKKIAQICHKSENAVKLIISRAKKKLKQKNLEKFSKLPQVDKIKTKINFK